ncbi:hypothetical protein AVEN_170452-1 [Araneus ventricosus]|uniref:Uncharacterized protein n=1 Tax=Araneus ventricosus TaxID=182803 RepID=A0A4Y2C0S0_ARAVE|nr:hypothetical protein AVEN_170452-1 [Araneus ventricosus]
MLTDTPEKDRIAKATNEKVEKIKKKHERKRPITTPEEHEEVSKTQFLCKSDTKCSLNEEGEFLEVNLNYSPYDLKINDFVLVEFSTKKTKVHYVGWIEKLEADEACVTFMQKLINETFVFPENDDTAIVQRDIIMKLPQPSKFGSTS